MRSEHGSSADAHRRAPGVLVWTLAAAVVVAGGAATVAPVPPAAADTVTVPFQDRLGCTPATGYEATSSPVFSKVGGSGAVADGATMSFDSAVSAYPMQPGTFSGVTNASGSFGYGSFGQEGYGSTSFYSGANGIGFSSIGSGDAGTLTITLPYAQRVQLTVGGIDAPSNIDVSGTAASGAPVPARTAAKSTTPRAATAQVVGSAARVTGGSVGGQDAVPAKAADVWFDEPVSTLTLRVFGAGGGLADGGFLVTPPLGCQSGSVAAADATADPVSAQAGASGDPTVTYSVPLSTTVTDDSPTTGMHLLPTVRSDLAAQVASLGGTLDAVTEDSSTSPACALPADVLTSRHLLGSAGALAPGETCTQTASATVTLPQDAATRTATTTSTLASSSNDTYSRVKDATTSTLTFPGVLAPLTLEQTGTTTAQPTDAVEQTITVTNPGPGAATSTTLTTDLGGFPATSCELDGAAVDCASLGDGTALGTLAAGQTRTLVLRGEVPSGTPPGTRYTVGASATSPNDTAGPATASGTLTVIPLGAPRFTAPAAGTTTTDRTPRIAGDNVREGAVVRVLIGDTPVCAVRAVAGGTFSCTPRVPLPVGAVTLSAWQEYGGITSGAGMVRFTITAEQRPGGSPTPVTPGAGPSGGSGTAGSGGATPSAPTGGGGAGAAPVPTASPSAPASPSVPSGGAAPGSGASGGGAPGGGASGDGAAGGGGADGALGMDIAFAQPVMQPGTATDMRGTLGPNGTSDTVDVAFTGRISNGMIYRAVIWSIDDVSTSCAVSTTTFSCSIPLEPGASADVDIRVYADALNAPATATQQLAVATSDPDQANALTSTVRVDRGPTDTEQLADAITTFDITSFPGATLPILSMLLFGLAATVVEGGRRRAANAAADAAPSPTGPPTDQPGSTP